MTKKTDDCDILAFVDKRWIKFDRDRWNTLYINEKVKEHLVWTGSIINVDSKSIEQDQSKSVQVKGKLPWVFQSAESQLRSYQNALFKSPENIINIESDIDTQKEYANVQKAYIIDKMKRGKIFDAYNDALMKQIWRGETVLFHEWGCRYGKAQNAVPQFDADNNPKQDEDGKPSYKMEFKQTVEYEGVLVKAIEPHDFVFDTTKVSSFTSSYYNITEFKQSSCVKIVRTWMSLSDITSKYNLDNKKIQTIKDFANNPKALKDKMDKLESIITSDVPKTEQNFDDFTNRYHWRYVNGDMLEVLHCFGDIRLSNGDVLKDWHAVTCANEVVLVSEESPYTDCPIVWMPDLVDITSRRGVSRLITAIDYNEVATQMFKTQNEALKFAINPAHFVKKGAHPVNNKKSINPGDWVEIDCEIGDVDFPKEIDSYKNALMLDEQLAKIEKYIQQSVGTNNNMMGTPDNPNQTATQTQQIMQGGNNRFNGILQDYGNIVLIPSVQLIARMFAENLPDDKVDKVQVKSIDGNIDITNVDDKIRKGVYNYTIGNAQEENQEKQKLQAMQPLVQFFSQVMGTKFKDTEMWDYACGIMDITNPARFLQTDELQQALSQVPPEQKPQLTKALMQMIQNPQLIQKAFAPPPQPQVIQQPAPPTPNKLVNDIAFNTIFKDNSIPDDVKHMLYQSLNLTPTAEAEQQIQDKLNQVHGKHQALKDKQQAEQQKQLDEAKKPKESK